MATLLLSHGAGGGVEARDLWALADALPAQGISVVLFEQPWRVAGRKIATAPPTLDAALRCAADVMRVRTPLVVGGRSAGARSAARTARALGAVGMPGPVLPAARAGARPSRPGCRSCRASACRRSWCRGSATRWGGPRSSPATSTGLDVVVIPGGDHGLKVPARGEVSQDEAMGIVVESTLEWLVREVVGNPRRG